MRWDLAGSFWDRANWQPLCKQCHDRKALTADIRPTYRLLTTRSEGGRRSSFFGTFRISPSPRGGQKQKTRHDIHTWLTQKFTIV